jgi:type II secretion system protein D
MGGGGGGGGQRFFVQGVKDDPRPSLLYDPQQDDSSSNAPAASGDESSNQGSLEAVAFQQPPAAGAQLPGGNINGPRGQVNVEALPELGVVVISGNTLADVEEVVNIINTIMRLAAGAEVKIQMVPLRFGDATSIANTLTQLYQRVVAGPAGNVARPGTPTQTTTAAGPFGAVSTSSQQASSIVLIPLPRFNAILVGAPEVRMNDVLGEIRRLDQPVSPSGRAVAIPLKRASAARVDALLTAFYASRYSTEPSTLDQVRFTHEDTTNTLFVQAGPADLEDIRQLVERIDGSMSNTINDVRVIFLHNALSDELAALLTQAVAQGAAAPVTAGAPGIIPAAAGAGLGAGLGGLGAGRGLGVAPGAFPGAAAPGIPAAAPAAGGAGGTGIKGTTLRFIEVGPRGRVTAQSGLLEDVRITSVPRINSLLLSAPPQTMELLLALTQRLDVPPAMRAEIKVFTMKKADANAIATMLNQLFLGAAGATPTTGAAGGITPAGGGLGGGLGGGGGLGAAGLGIVGGGGLGGGGLGAAGGAQALPSPTGAFPGAAAIPRTPFTLGPTTPEGAPLIPISMTVDQRTNSLIIGGSRNDLNVIEAMIATLEETDVQSRSNEVYALRNAAAADVATALQSFLTQSIQVLSVGQQLSAFQELQRSVIIVPEPVTNKLLVSTTPQYFNEINRMIAELDSQPPMVVIQVMFAEVDLNTTEEFGVEIGLQSPVLFQRGVIPSLPFLGAGTINYANATGGLVPPGVTVNSTINPAAQPGFNFNNVSLPLGNNPVVGPGTVGFQGLTNLGVGRVSPTSGVGGFVFSASSDTFNLLVRALKTQGRIDILSRPQIETLDNQTAYMDIGQSVPYVTGSAVASTGLVTNLVAYRDVGVILQVTPRISPDNTVLMRVIPEVSSVAPTTISLGNGQQATEFDVQHFETTVFARDGETVVIGGLIQKRDTKTENKVPVLGDLPYLGALFRYRTQDKNKVELLVIMTPHIVRTHAEAEHILLEESSRMDWISGEVSKTQGIPDLGSSKCPPGPAPLALPNLEPPGAGLPGVPVPESAAPAAPATPQPRPREVLPEPRRQPAAGQPPTPGATGQPPPPMGPAAAQLDGAGSSPTALPASTASTSGGQPAGMDSAPPPKEKKTWKWFRSGD